MKQLYAFIALFLLTTSLSFGQRDFRSGYIVQNGDTVRGLVNYQGDKRQAVLATFKSNKDAKEQNFTPVLISGYGIDDVYAYESKKIITPDSSYHLFLTTLVKGPASLYFYKDKNSGDHFYIEKSDSLKELVYKKVQEAQPTGEMAFVTYNTYKKTLFNEFKDCPTTGASINKLTFKEADLIRIFTQYNQCVAPAGAPVYKVKARKSIVTYGVQAGAHKSSYTLTTDSPELSAASNIGYHAGIMLNATLPWASERISAQFEAQYAYTNYKDQGAFDHNNGHTEYTLDITYHHIKLPISIRYTLPGRSIKPFFNAGAVLNYSPSQEERYSGTFKFTYNKDPNTFDRGLVPYTGKFFPGYIVGAGVILPAWGSQNATLEIRYETNSGNSRTAGYNTKTNQVSLTLGMFL